MDNPKSLMIKLAAGFLGVLLFLTFFSNTIFTLNLPGVVVGMPARGAVISTFRSFGDIEFAEIKTLFAQEGGRINFAVGVGDRVSYGDMLFSIEADRQDLLYRLEEEQSRLDAVLINLERTRGDLAFEQSRLARLSPDTARPPIHAPDITRFEHEARRLEAEIERAQAEYDTNTLLFGAGGISQSQLNDSAHRLNQLRESYARNAEEMDIILQTHIRDVADAEEHRRRNFEAEQNSLLHRIDTLGHSVRLLELEENDRLRGLQRLYDQIEADGLAIIYAEVDGIVREIPLGLESGMVVSSNQILMRYAIDYGGEFIVTAEFPERIGAFPAGGNIRINIPAVHQIGIQGHILRTTASGGRLRMEIAFSTHVHLNGGERAEIILERISNLQEGAEGYVLPNSAIRQDFAGHYIMYLEREANMLLGYSYYARQMRIFVLDEGDRFTLFIMITADEFESPVIITSDRPFWQGSRVRVVGDE